MPPPHSLHAVAIRPATLINNLTIVVTPSLPIGLAYVVAAIEDLVSLQVIDAIAERPGITDVTPFDDDLSILGLTAAETVARIEQAPDICLVSSMFSTEWPVVKELIARVREQYPDCVIVGGGEHFSAAAEYSLRASELDLCVVGEGEETIRELVGRLIDDRTVPLDVAGTVTTNAETGEITRAAPRTRMLDLPAIPYPAWERFNVEAFLDRGIGQFDQGREVRAMPFVATRGCPYRCTFCSNDSMWGTRWLARPPRELLAEWKLWIERYGVNHFDSCDLTAIVKRQWLVEFCTLLIEEDLAITWGMPSGTRSEALDEETLTLLKRSGCADITYAPESGSDDVLRIMKKKISKPAMLDSMRACHRAGIVAKANIILGYPEETRRHVLETYRFIVAIAMAGVEDLMVTGLSPYPGSAVFDQLTAEGRITMDEEYFHNLSQMSSLDSSVSYSHHYGTRELQLFKLGGWVLFYSFSLLLRPRRIAVLLRDLARGNGTTRLSKGLLSLFRRRRNLRRIDHDMVPARAPGH